MSSPHEAGLIATVAVGLGAAFVIGLLAVRVGLPPLVGYLLAGIVVGPFTPGVVANSGIAAELAELGIVLLMFGVGLHFSLRDLAAVRRVVVPGAVALTTLTGGVGAAIALSLGWGAGGAAVLALALGVASTVVVLKGLENGDRLDSPEGRLAVGWLVVEDVLMVFALVLLPALAPALGGAAGAGDGALFRPVAIAIAKVGGFVGLMFFVGRRTVPWLLAHVARLGSRELFTLAVLVIALGVGTIASRLFGVSFALGAFFAGAVISESELSHRAAEDALPMRDAFAVLFFVSVGMLFDPRVLVRRPLEIALLVGVVVVWKAAAAFGLLRALGQSSRTGLLTGAALGQIGEFSFIVAALGVSLGLVNAEVQAVIVAVALISITLNAPALSLAARLSQRAADRAAAHAHAPSARMTREMRASGALAPAMADADTPISRSHDPYDYSELTGHVVLIGYGRVGTTVTAALARAGATHVVIEEQERIVSGLRSRGEHAVRGDATRPDVLERAGIAGARLLIVTAPEPIRARRIVEVARQANARLNVAVRTHSAAEQEYYESTLAKAGAGGRAVYAEREAALGLAHYALTVCGRSDDEADVLVHDLREQPTRATEMFTAVGTQEFRAMTRDQSAPGVSP
jgi:monovalent cation:H+ antiporter-2, CPA2 family